jgi:hypothetical protein
MPLLFNYGTIYGLNVRVGKITMSNRSRGRFVLTSGLT